MMMMIIAMMRLSTNLTFGLRGNGLDGWIHKFTAHSCTFPRRRSRNDLEMT